VAQKEGFLIIFPGKGSLVSWGKNLYRVWVPLKAFPKLRGFKIFSYCSQLGFFGEVEEVGSQINSWWVA